MNKELINRFKSICERIKSIYFASQKLLVRKPLKWVALAFSHGIAHIAVLVLLAIYTLYEYNKQISTPNVKTHFFQLDVYSRIKPELKDKGISEGGQLAMTKQKSVEITFKINNDQIKKSTDKKYDSAIDIHYENDVNTDDSAHIDLVRYPCDNPVEAVYKRHDSLNHTLRCYSDSSNLFSVTAKMTDSIPMPTPPDIKYTDIRILTNDLHTDEDNQFYYYHLSFRDLRDIDNSLANTFKSITIELDTLNTKYWPPSSNMPIVYHQLTPAPDRLSGGYIVYGDSAKLSEIAKNGIFIYAEDLDKAQTIRKSEFQNSVWLGVLFAFCLDIIVQLVIKWRNLIRKRRKEE